MNEARGGDGGALERAVTDARAALAEATFAVLTVPVCCGALAFATLGQRRPVDALIRAWARSLLAMTNVHVEAEGLEQLPPPGRGCIYLFNHQSHVDVLAIHAAIQRTLRFGAKIELFRIPIFGAAMRAAGVLPIARASRAEVFRVYREAGAKLDEGWSFVLAPEGTRQDEPRIGPFKKGPFYFALEAQAPLVPIVLKGTHEVLPKRARLVNAGRWRRTVKLRVLAPVETRGLGRDDLPRLVEAVRARMVAAYDSM